MTMAKVIGLDYGAARIGVAISDEDLKYAFTFGTVENHGLAGSLDELENICRSEGVSRIVVGLPLNQHGQIGSQASEAKAFGAELGKRLAMPVVYEDERFTSVMANKLFRESGRKTRETRQLIDQKSAQLILQSYLDREHGKIS